MVNTILLHFLCSWLCSLCVIRHRDRDRWSGEDYCVNRCFLLSVCTCAGIVFFSKQGLVIWESR
uniref:Putative ovule protein n=1 Tax=Solanum chacoense TaxID=4108 RepID=A0A0V0GYZ9_SOLCH